MLDEATETVVEGRALAIATLELVPRPGNSALVLLCYQLDFLHLVLFIQELLEEFFVWDVPMVQGLYEILFEDLFELRQLVEFSVLQLLKLSSKAISQLDEMLRMKLFLHEEEERSERILVLLLPVKHERAELVPREFVLRPLFRAQLIVDFNFLLDHILAFSKHLNLRVEFVHLIFVLEDQVLIPMSYFALEVLRAHG